MNASDELVEVNKFADNYYGTPKSFVNDSLSNGNNIITAIDVNGAFNVRKAFPQAHLIFIEPPSLEDLKKRLEGRGTETDEAIQKRLDIASSEIAKKDQFDVCVITDNIEDAVLEIANYIKKFLK